MGKKSKGSRKGKKAWRANISTEDIDDFLNKSTKDSLSGGSLTHLPTDDLFYVDKSSDLSVKRKIEKQREKVIRWDSVLEKNAFVKPVPSSVVKKPKKKLKEVKIRDSKDDESKDSAMDDLWDGKCEQNKKGKKISKTSIIPAVEVEPPGCSFNPSFESHQDSLAHAVADEMQKVFRKELGPEPVPLTVVGEAIDEDDMYFLEVDHGSDDDEEDESNENLDESGDTEKKSLKSKRVTRVKLNRRARHKEQLKIEAESKKLKKFSKEFDSIPDIIQEIAKEDEEKQKRHIRRNISKQERLKIRPPRFGRHKFQAAPAQVLLSEEITGSLRKLKGCCTLARDRFKSLEKRGLIVPTAKSGRK
jgi:nucleolar protein 53